MRTPLSDLSKRTNIKGRDHSKLICIKVFVWRVLDGALGDGIGEISRVPNFLSSTGRSTVGHAGINGIRGWRREFGIRPL